MRAYFVDGRGTTEREVGGELGQLRQEYRLSPPGPRTTPVDEGEPRGPSVVYAQRCFTLRRFMRPIYRGEGARLAGERPIMQEEIAVYVEDGVDPDRALANLVAHIGPYKYAEVP